MLKLTSGDQSVAQNCRDGEDYHQSYGHDFQSVSVNHVLDFEQQKDTLRRFAEEVIPLVKAELSTTLWTSADKDRAKGFTAVD